MTKTATETGQALRQCAEEKLKVRESATPEPLSPKEAQQLLHELQVHQIELGMQNEELHRTQHELDRSRARYFDLYDLAPVGYLAISEQGLLQEANLAAATMLGMTRGALVKQPISRFILKEDQDIYYLRRKQLLETGEPQACELRMARGDGTAFWAHLAATADRNVSGDSGQAASTNSGQDTGSAPMLRIVLSDISGRKRAEEALLESNCQLKEATILAHELAAKAEAASQAKSQFLANMSHELRTPMTGVLGMLDLVLSGNLEAKQREFIENSRRSALAMVRILNDILDLTKIEAGKLTIEAQPFSVRTCVENTSTIFFPAAQGKGIDFTCTVADDVPETLLGDQNRINQVLTNLVGNALKFTRKGKIELRVTAGGSAPDNKRDVTFTITDTGVGIPEDKKHLLFRVFSQVDDSHTRDYGGAGLGLAICKEIVERMGGAISCTSEVGKGSIFSCTIPLGVAKLQHAAVSEKTATMPRVEELQRSRILIAEDDPTIRQVLGSMLQMSNYETDFAENGQKVVEKWENGEYNLILMDVQMPLLNGFEATAAIREKERTRGGHISIIAMTAHAQKEDGKRCLDAGMDGYISKPIDFQLTLQVIRESLSP